MGKSANVKLVLRKDFYTKLNNVYKKHGPNSSEFFRYLKPYIYHLLKKFSYNKSMYDEDNQDIFMDCWGLLYEKLAVSKLFNPSKGSLGNYIYTLVKTVITNANCSPKANREINCDPNDLIFLNKVASEQKIDSTLFDLDGILNLREVNRNFKSIKFSLGKLQEIDTLYKQGIQTPLSRYARWKRFDHRKKETS